MLKIFKQNETDTYVVKVIKNPFFWVFLFFLFVPWVTHEILYLTIKTPFTNYHVYKYFRLWDFLYFSFWFILGLIPRFPHDASAFDLFGLLLGTIGITELSALVLSLGNKLFDPHVVKLFCRKHWY